MMIHNLLTKETEEDGLLGFIALYSISPKKSSASLTASRRSSSHFSTAGFLILLFSTSKRTAARQFNVDFNLKSLSETTELSFSLKNSLNKKSKEEEITAPITSSAMFQFSSVKGSQKVIAMEIYGIGTEQQYEWIRKHIRAMRAIWVKRINDDKSF
ncbi:hypothetical protein F8388_025803 [Cannabis sativa]|uniref:Uncharacterized protein n=1 Tax=Cannabis sativa TaxID=3483 RepID=A0A7J6F9U0_CANSA|nr:hypothetical protein F8388_025803 [Cannabis sativa]